MTSKLNYKTETVCENLKKKININGIERTVELHSVLTYKTESRRLGCINRDKNSVQNMKKIVKVWLGNKIRPDNYNRQKVAQPRKGVKCVNVIPL